MFYSTTILQKKGPLGNLWLAAHHDVSKKFSKLQILSTNIAESAGVMPTLPACARGVASRFKSPSLNSWV